MGDDGRGDFGQSLLDFRHRAALSQEELAERAAMTAKAISALERGERRRPYPSTVRALCDALELDEVDRAELMDAVPRSPGRADRSRLATLQPATALVGREVEVAQLSSLLGSGASSRRKSRWTTTMSCTSIGWADSDGWVVGMERS